MKHFLFYLSFSLYFFACNVHPINNIANGRKNASLVAPIYDTTELRIEVVHNPKYLEVYGIELRANNPTQTLKIEKIILGNTKKIYDDTCYKAPYPKYIFEHCLVNPKFPISTLAFEGVKILPKKFKCEVYYSINQVKKINYTSFFKEIDCRIGISYPLHQDLPKECVWAIGFAP